MCVLCVCVLCVCVVCVYASLLLTGLGHRCLWQGGQSPLLPPPFTNTHTHTRTHSRLVQITPLTRQAPAVVLGAAWNITDPLALRPMATIAPGNRGQRTNCH